MIQLTREQAICALIALIDVKIPAMHAYRDENRDLRKYLRQQLEPMTEAEKEDIRHRPRRWPLDEDY